MHIIYHYLVMGKEYSDGHGRGTSYLIDTYMDFGYIGVILFSFLWVCFFLLSNLSETKKLVK